MGEVVGVESSNKGGGKVYKSFFEKRYKVCISFGKESRGFTG